MRLRAWIVSEKVLAGVIIQHRRDFIRIQAIKGIFGLTLALAYILWAGDVGFGMGFVLAGLAAPLGMAAAARLPIRIRILELASLSIFAVVIAVLAGLTGGMASPFRVWLLMVPLEGALAGRRRTVLYSGVAALLALTAVWTAELNALLPGTLLAQPRFISGCSLLMAIAYGTLIAIGAQGRRSTADAAAAAGEARFQFLAENASDLITRHSADGRITYASPAAQALLRYGPDALAGKTLSELAHAEDGAKLAAVFSNVHQNGVSASIEVRLTRADDVVIWTEMRCRPAGDIEDERRSIVAVTRDVSERKAHERALIEARNLAEDASRAKSRFLANMSHELRTPLNAIIGFSEVMTCQMFGPLGMPRYVEYARLINESGTHLLELINSILDMSKIEAGRFRVVPERFDLDEAAAQALRFVELLAERQGVQLERDIPEEARHIVADRRAVMQIFINLLSNGVKYTPNGGIVRLSSQRMQDGVELIVSDTGQGIAPENLEKLGQPFEQAEGAYTRSKEGTGLGLALVRAMAHLHGGSMRIESELGAGTTVRVLLPDAAENTAGAVAGAA